MNRQNRRGPPKKPEPPAVTETAPAENPNASDIPTTYERNQPKAPHPACIGIRAALDMVSAGSTIQEAATWLASNYPHHFKDAREAEDAMADPAS